MAKLGKLFTTLFVLGAIGLAIASYFNEDVYKLVIAYQPPTYLYGVFGFILMAYAGYSFYISGWEEAQPNEWLVIIQDGEQVKAGVGMICFRNFMQTAIRFPSAVQKINFNAMQVCLEMQGLEIQGFAVWSVHREKPFLYYKQMHGFNANTSIQKVCESIVRHQIANSNLDTVITKRETLRDNMKEELQKILTGWGVWLETVEITEVRICSYQLFEDMQTPNKQDNYLKSEKYKLKINSEMSIDDEANTLKRNRQNEKNSTEQTKNRIAQDIKKLKQQITFKEKECEFQKKKIQQESNLKMERAKKRFERELEEKKNRLATDKLNSDEQRRKKIVEIEGVQNMSETNLKLFKLEENEKMMSKLNLNNLDIHKYSTSQDSNLLNLIPQVKLQTQEDK